jgi:predicted helicase
MDEFWTRHQKYHELERLGDAFHCDYTDVADNSKNIWLTEGMANDWDELLRIGSKESKRSHERVADVLMRDYTLGVATARDSWVYNFDENRLASNVSNLIREYNWHVHAWASTKIAETEIDSFVESDNRKISWSRDLKVDMTKGRLVEFDSSCIRVAQYRPFTSSHLYFHRVLNEEVRKWPLFAPIGKKNVYMVVGGYQRRPFSAIASDAIPDMNILADPAQCFPLYTYDEDGTNRKDNITDWGLEQFQSHYKDASITKLDIFHYVYGILHDPAYRTKYAANLKRELPRIPFAENFWKVAETGKSLMDIHVHYEDQPEYPLTELWSLPKGYVHPYGLEVTSIDQVPERDRYRVTKMKRDKKDPTRLIVNDFLTLAGIPANVDDYKLGNRSALDWIIDQYQVSTDKRSGITNDPNRDDDPTYIIRLIKKVVTVSVETVGVVEGMENAS